MTKAELDYILGTMLDSHKNVSDLNITVDPGTLQRLRTTTRIDERGPAWA
jgi:hypothetical protein